MTLAQLVEHLEQSVRALDEYARELEPITDDGYGHTYIDDDNLARQHYCVLLARLLSEGVRQVEKEDW